MATDGIIDTLKVVVSLDPAKFEEGRKKIDASFEGTKTRARKTAEELESAGKQGAEFFNLLTDRALRLGAVMLGGVGIEKFLENTTRSGNAAFYMSKNIGLSVEELGRWQNVVRQLGGDAAQVAPELLQLSQRLADIQVTGQDATKLYPVLQALHIDPVADHATNKVKTVAQLLPEIHKGLQDLVKIDPRLAYNLVARLGLPSLINALEASDPVYKELIKNADAAGTKTTKQAEAAVELTKAWGNLSSFMDRVGSEFAGEIDPALTGTINLVTRLGEAIDGLGDHSFQDLFSFIGGIFGGVLGLPGGPAGVIAGATVGSALGAGLGADKDRGPSVSVPSGGKLWSSFKDTVSQAVEAPGNQLPSFGRAPPAQRPTAPDWTGSAGHAVLSPEQVSAPPAQRPINAAVFDLIQQLEGASPDTITPTHKPSNPFAYGRNQVTLLKAREIDPSATADKLKIPSYNDDIARRIQAQYLARYHGDVEAVSIAYNAGQDAADRFVASGRILTSLPAETQGYLARERAITAAAGATTNTTSSVVHIGSIPITAGKATDAAGIAASIREELASNQLLNQGNAGPQ